MLKYAVLWEKVNSAMILSLKGIVINVNEFS
jgi:hypothetical protein